MTNTIALKKKILDDVFVRIIDNWDNHIDEEGNFTVDEESVLQSAVDSQLFDEDFKEEEKEALFMELYESNELATTLGEAEQAVKDQAEDQREWNKGPMSYYGLKNSDFI